jgi:hypothetical protein
LALKIVAKYDAVQYNMTKYDAVRTRCVRLLDVHLPKWEATDGKKPHLTGEGVPQAGFGEKKKRFLWLKTVFLFVFLSA